MIPDIAVIVSAYAIARLLNEYVLTEDNLQPIRFIVSLIACGVIGLFLFSVIEAGSGIGDLNI